MFKNFDLSWFLTTPGILTCLGCLLIIISIIIFISSLRGNKIKKEVNTNNETISEVNGVVNNEPLQQVDNNTLNNGIGVDPMLNLQTENVLNEGVNPVVAPPINVTEQVPVVESNVAPVNPVEVTPVTVEPTPMEPINVAPVNPVEVTPVAVEPTPVEITPNVVVEQTFNQGTTFTGINIEPEIKPVPSVNNLQETNSVNLPYGGVNPTVPPVPMETENKVIYGGADPLAGTGVLPTVTPTQVTELKKTEDIESL